MEVDVNPIEAEKLDSRIISHSEKMMSLISMNERDDLCVEIKEELTVFLFVSWILSRLLYEDDTGRERN